MVGKWGEMQGWPSYSERNVNPVCQGQTAAEADLLHKSEFACAISNFFFDDYDPCPLFLLLTCQRVCLCFATEQR